MTKKQPFFNGLYDFVALKLSKSRITGTCARHQRYIAGEVKKARFIALLPFVK